MAKDGSARPSLNERLRARTQAERSEIEELTRSELRQLAESLKRESKTALDSMQNDTRSRIETVRAEMGSIERRQRHWWLWSALVTIAMVLIGLVSLWGTSLWLRWTLDETRTELARVQLRIGDERRVLEALRRKTGGVRIQRYADGSTFVELPAGTDMRTIYRCREGKVPCVKLPASAAAGR